MHDIRQASLFTLLAISLMAFTSIAFAPVALAESLHLSEKERAHKVLTDRRVPIIFGSLGQEDDAPTVRIPQPRRR